MTKLARAERRYRVTDGRLVQPTAPVVAVAQRTPNHDERQRLGRIARRMFKRVGTCPRSKVRGLPAELRDAWYSQRAKVHMSRFYAEREWATFGWLCLWGAAEVE